MIEDTIENSRTGLEIAVIGMAGRFPGANDIHEFWDHLKQGVESICFFSDRELEEAGIDARLLKNPNYVKAYGLLEGIDCFDSDFFGYTPREAGIMDPQGRVFLECAWRALEDAGYCADTYEGLIGLYAGATSSSNWEAVARLSGKTRGLGYWVSDYLMNKDFLSSRVSYKLNLRGPVVSIQTACSTSLTAIHVAGQAILNGECDMALAGGVTIAVWSRFGYLYQEGMILSPDGHCRAFDVKAKGTVGGDGVGVVVLKRLERAAEDGDHIYAVIKGSAINNDGVRKVGFTAPSIDGEAEAIVAAQEMAEVEAESITYVETHGTATELGDPVEMEALAQAFATTDRGFCAIGSIKTNVGHLDSAAGVAGFIKTVLALTHRLIPPSLHFNTPNPRIHFNGSPFYVNTRLREWHRNGYPLRAGVSSFGIGGTNAHVVLEEAPVQALGEAVAAPPGEIKDRLILLSANSGEALQRVSQNLVAFLKAHPHTSLADVAYTLQLGRKAFKYRQMTVSSSVEELAAAFTSPASTKVRPSILKEIKPTVVFLFPGLGSQYVNMGRGLYEKVPAFAQEMDRCFEILRPLLDGDLKEMLYPVGGQDRMGEPPGAEQAGLPRLDISHPLLFMVEYALARLLMKWGVKPDVMMGYSLGEFTAACLSGVFSIEDALPLVFQRSRLVQKTPAGAMLSVPLPIETLQPLLTEGVSLAIDNGPSCIVAGLRAAVLDFENRLKKRKILCLRLPITHGCHCRAMAPIAGELEEMVGRIPLHEPQIPYISNVTGQWITLEKVLSPAYWATHLQGTVQFDKGMKELVKDEESIFIQVGPDRDLAALVRRYVETDPAHPHRRQAVVHLMRHRQGGTSDVSFLLNRLGRLWLSGVSLDWRRLYEGERRRRISLPTYPFEALRYPLEQDPAGISAGMLAHSGPVSRKAELADWFYVPLWEQTLPPRPVSPDSVGKRNWLVFIDGCGLAERLVGRLQGWGQEVTVVRPGTLFSPDSDDGFILRPGYGEDYDRLFAALQREGKRPHQLLHLWGVTGNKAEESQLEGLDRTLDLGFYSLLHIVQAMGHLGMNEEMTIQVVTDNMQSVTGEETLCPLKAAVLGAVKIIPLEYPNVKCRSIDIVLPLPGSDQDRKLLDLLAAEFRSDSFQPVTAFRGPHRWLPMVKSCPLEPAAGVGLRPKGVYLVTGGFGGMGLTLAQYLAEHYQARLVLTGRSPSPPRKDWDRWLTAHEREDRVSEGIRQVRAMEDAGARVVVFSADVADLQQMQEVVARAEAQVGPINGVLHTAGLADYEGAIQRRTRQATQRILAPKVRGTLVLDRVLKDADLDFFVLFSSTGNFMFHEKFGQVGYNAANEFLDAYAHYRSAVTGQLTVSINWTDWLERGMLLEAVERALGGKVDTSKLDYPSIFRNALTPAEGVEVFLRVLAARLPRVAVSALDLNRLLEQINQRLQDNTLHLHTHSLKDLERSVRDADEGLTSRPPLDTEYAPPESETQQVLCRLWQDFFGIRRIGIHDDFFELGGDSLKAMTLAARLHQQTGARIPLAEFFKTSTIKGLAAFIEASGDDAHDYALIPSAEKREYYALSSAQKRLYILQQMAPGSTTYNETRVVVLEGECAGQKLAETFGRLIQRHEVFRTALRLIDDEPVQQIHKAENVEFNVVHHAFVENREEGSEEGTARLVRDFVQPFDLSRAPLLRAGLIRAGEHRHILVVDMHHMVTDGLSNEIFVKEFMTLYGGASLPRLRLQYKDYSMWRQNEKLTEIYLNQKLFWVSRFQGEVPVLQLPFDYARPSVQGFAGSGVDFVLGKEETMALRKAVLRQDTTLFMVLLSIFNVLLSKLSGQEDIVVGAPIAGRRHADLERLIGVFINTLVLRNFPTAEKTFNRFLAEVRADTLAAFDNQEYPFEDLVEQVNTSRDAGRNPLYDVVFVMQHVEVNTSPVVERDTPGLKWSPYDYENRTAKFDLTLRSVESADRLFFTMEYCTKLFKEQTIRRMIGYFKKIVSLVTAAPAIRLGDIEVLSAEERQEILVGFNDTGANFPIDAFIHHLFEARAAGIPDRIAVWGDGRGLPAAAISYGELDRQAHQLASWLRGEGVRPDTIVAICVQPSLEMIVGLLGIWKAGGAYLPIDPDYPAARVDYMMADSGARIVLTDHSLNRLSRLSTGNGVLAQHTIPTQPTQRGPMNLAYVIYTSGTTGRPKGVLISHRNVVRLFCNDRFPFEFSRRDVWTLFHSYCFDFSVWEMAGALLTGGKLVIIAKMAARDPEQFLDILVLQRVTVLNQTPSAFYQLMDYQFKNPGKKPNLRYVIFGGEALKPAKLKPWKKSYPQTALINMYGITETTVHVTFKEITDSEVNTGRSNIGKPLPTLKTYVLDRNHRLLPLGVAGELMVGGEGVGRGYLNKPVLTAGKFIPHFPGQPGRLYCSGDCVRLLATGEMEYLGRIDQQVKIRGYRIEVAEIERQLVAHDDVEEALVVAAVGDDRDDPLLCAYMVTTHRDVSYWRTYLARKLPEYMIPSYFIPVDSFPLTPSGKVDKKQLPPPSPQAAARQGGDLPADEIEAGMVEIWSQVLGVDRDVVGVNTNFFELGGHSLRAAVLINRIHETLAVRIPLAELFVSPTIRGLSRYVRSARSTIYEDIKPVEKREYYPQSSAQKRLFFLDQFEDIGTSYNMTCVLKIKGQWDQERYRQAFEALITRHETLRTSFALIEDQPVQRVHPRLDFDLEYYEAEGEDVVESTGKRFLRPFDLSCAPLLRVGTAPLADGDRLLLFDIHHIIGDGTSVGILVDDWSRLYEGRAVVPLKIQYKDFSLWQNRLVAAGQIKPQEDYWLNLYRGEIPRLNLPTDFPRPAVFNFAGDTVDFRLDGADASNLKAFALQSGTTLFMNLLAAFNVLLYKYTGQEDIVVGSGIAGRGHTRLQHLIGMFVNMLAVRNQPRAEKSCREFLQEVRANCIDAFENQDVQFEDLVDRLNLPRDPSRNPLFDVSMVVQNFEQSREKIKETGAISPLEFKGTTSKFDITLFAVEMGDTVFFTLEYCTRLFKLETMERWAAHLVEVIRQTCKTPDTTLSAVELMNEAEKRQVLCRFNDTAAPYPKEQTIDQLLAAQVRRTPHGIALVRQDHYLSYRQLAETAAPLARYLQVEKSIGPETRVGILVESSFERLAAIWGVLEAGGGFVPLEPPLPQERLEVMIKDAGIGVVLSAKRHLRLLNRLQWACPCFHTFICLDSRDIQGEVEREKSELMDEALWTYVAQAAVDDITAGGWLSSYTGRPFSPDEMDEYGDNILKKVGPLLHPRMRVLEIGCASGISMYRIAPKVGFYLGSDLSEVIIRKNRERVAAEGHQHIALHCAAAHQVDRLGEEDFELVILNSVIQCFPGHNYLRRVVRQCIDLMAQQGCIFIGDVMNGDLKEAFIRDLKDFRRKAVIEGEKYRVKTDFSQELFVSPAFFDDLCLEIPEIEKVEQSGKIYSLENELTAYRYDVMITVDKNRRAETPGAVKRKYQQDAGTLEGYRSRRSRSGRPQPDAANLCYLIYTSGTTGLPRGVMVEHRSLVNLCCWHNTYFQVSRRDHTCQYAGFGFDAAVWEVFPYLVCGAALFLPVESVKLDMKKLAEYFDKNHITISFLPTQVCEQFMEQANRSLRVLLTGGDKLHTFIPGSYRLFNNYGPTENTVVTTSFPVDRPYDNIPIGGPIANHRIYVVDKNNHPLPMGAPGELLVGGDGICRGYLNQPDLTAEKFVNLAAKRREGTRSSKCRTMTGLKNLTLNTQNLKLYKTGDLVRWREDGSLEFLGRIDSQVKIRGIRIELGEIETQLLAHDGVRETVVLDRQDDTGSKYLCAYLVPTYPLDVSAVKEFLLGRLPAYMVPAHFVELPEIPLTPNGKVDRAALPAPGMETPDGDFIAPFDPLEKRLARVWAEVLGIEAKVIGVDSNFFDLGGHSLKATVLISRIRKEFHSEFPLARAFSGPTIREFAAFIKEAKASPDEEIKPVERREYYPQSSAQRRLFFLDQLEDIATSYNIPCILKVEGELDIRRFGRTFQALVARHEALRTSFGLVGHEPVQRVHDEVDFKIEYPAIGSPEAKIEIAEMIRQFIRPFDLSSAPLLRVELVSFSASEHLLLLDMHHIISDGTSMGILASQFFRLYDGEELPPPKIQYKDFSLWQHHLLQSGKIKEQEEYWLRVYNDADALPVLHFPTDFPRPETFSFQGDIYGFELGRQETLRLRELASASGATLYMVLLAAFNVLLYKYTGQEDIVVGSGIAGRPHVDLQDIVGMFVNTLALRNRPRGGEGFMEFLEEVRSNCVMAFENQDLQFEELVDRLNIQRDASRNPLFAVELNVQNFERPQVAARSLGDLKFTAFAFDYHTCKFDMILYAVEQGEGISFNLEYATALFKRATIEKIARRYLEILEQVSGDHHIRLMDIQLSHDIEFLSSHTFDNDPEDFQF